MTNNMKDDMKDEVIKTQISYIEKEVGNLSKKFSEFVSNQDAKLIAISATFVRSDVLAETLKGIDKTMKTISDNYDKQESKLEEVTKHLPMIKDIKKERDGVKFQFMQLTGKVLFWVVAVIIGITAVVK